MLNMDESQRHWVTCETRLKGFYTVHSLSYRNHLSSCQMEALRLATQGHQGTLECSICYLWCWLQNYIHWKNSTNCPLKRGNFMYINYTSINLV